MDVRISLDCCLPLASVSMLYQYHIVLVIIALECVLHWEFEPSTFAQHFLDCFWLFSVSCIIIILQLVNFCSNRQLEFWRILH